MAVKLSDGNLSQVSSNFFSKPTYDRSQVKSGILHIGPSAFFRAHLAVYADDLLHNQSKAEQPMTWGITAVSMRSSDVRDDIAPQDYLYTLTSKGKNVEEGRIIGSIRDIMVARENPQAVLEAAADPDIKVISLTVTQKGYYYDKEKGLDFDHPDIIADLNSNSESMSSIGLIVSSLDLRRQRGIVPPTIMSMDNFSGNGTILRTAVLAYAKHKSSELHDWISKHVEFPNSMVDRITPSKSNAHIAFVTDHGIHDARPVEAEPMPNLPFVIENVVSRVPETGKPVEMPDFASLKTKIDKEVSPYENMKIRTLNGSHMALGCIGHMMDYKFAHEAMQDPAVRSFIKGFMAEAGQTLDAIEEVNLDDYRDDTLSRFDNNKICDPLTRLARDGSKKAETRFLNTLKDCIATPNASRGHMTFGIAAWIQYIKGLDSEGYIKGTPHVNEKGEKIPPNDENAIRIGLKGLISDDTTDPSAIFAVSSIFSHDLAGNREIIDEVKGHLEAIHNNGIEQALNDFLEARPEIPGLLMKVTNDNAIRGGNEIQEEQGFSVPQPL